jgi:hypothetical protein
MQLTVCGARAPLAVSSKIPALLGRHNVSNVWLGGRNVCFGASFICFVWCEVLLWPVGSVPGVV